MNQLAVNSEQLSIISYQLSINNYQLSMLLVLVVNLSKNLTLDLQECKSFPLLIKERDVRKDRVRFLGL